VFSAFRLSFIRRELRFLGKAPDTILLPLFRYKRLLFPLPLDRALFHPFALLKKVSKTSLFPDMLAACPSVCSPNLLFMPHIFYESEGGRRPEKASLTLHSPPQRDNYFHQSFLFRSVGVSLFLPRIGAAPHSRSFVIVSLSAAFTCLNFPVTAQIRGRQRHRRNFFSPYNASRATVPTQ